MVHQVLRNVKKHSSTSIDKLDSNITCKGSISKQSIHNRNNNIHIHNNTNSIPREYQVATPRSPNDMNRQDLTDVSPRSDHHMIDTLSMSNNNENHHSMIISSRDSEDIERLKYETAKDELLDKLNVHILLSHKKSDKIKREISRIHAQMKLMKKLHDDTNLLTKIENYTTLNLHSRQNIINRQHSVTFVDNSISSHNSSHTPQHHYHTRSKSQGNLLADSYWKDCIDDPILTSRTNKKLNPTEKQFYSNKINTNDHFTGTSTPNYMIEPTINNKKNLSIYNNHPVFRRKDGIRVLLTCSICRRQGFMTVKGVTSHIKTKHEKSYENPKLAVLDNQWLLPDEFQDTVILKNFRTLNLDPQSKYLPIENDIKTKKNGVTKKTNTKGITQLTRSTSHSTTTKNQSHSITYQSNEEEYNIDHLKKFCNKDELTNLIEMVKTSKQDLGIILQQPTDNESESESESEQELQIEIKTPESVNDADYESPNSPLSSNCSSPVDDISMNNSPSVSKSSSPPVTTIATRRMSLRKRKQIEDDVGEDDSSIPWKERLRPSEKKPRPDVIALSELPEHEKRSKHYNLRARSKLRSSSVEEDL